MTQRYLVSAALPYANGAIHLGHLVEYIQADIFVRALRMAENDVLFVCGADSHGTAIEINAKKAGIEPEAFITKWQKAHEASFKAFDIHFDGGYGTTHTPSNEAHAGAVFKALHEKGLIKVRDVEQLFDETDGRFLADRQIRGTCPKCKAEDQYGDACEKCGSTYRPTELINPKSAISGATPVIRSSKHYFVDIQHYTQELLAWTKKPVVLQKDVQNFLHGWFEEGLKDWDISRDGPYFGFKIPGEDNKYFYVWLDAPIGYISLSEKAAKERGQNWEDYWLNKDCQIIHFIGKDIVYFHTLFWPAMLMAAGYTLPSSIAIHGMLTVNGEKMSKSRGTFVLADTFAKYIRTDALRYYYACKLNDGIKDIDLSFEDFVARVNADLVNKVVNLLSRTIPMLHRYHEGKPGDLDENEAQELLALCEQTISKAQQYYQERDFSSATKVIVELSEAANRYLQEKAPWETVKKDPELARIQLTTAAYIGKVCIGLLKPILPAVAKQVERILVLDEEMRFSNIHHPFSQAKSFLNYERLFERIENTSIEAIMQDSKQDLVPSKQISSAPSSYIGIDDFVKVDLRAAKVLDARLVEGADKLLSVDLDVGNGEKRHVFSGLRPHVEPQDLIGRTVCLVYNLAPRKMRFGMSEGMILATGNNPPRPIFLDGANPGDKVS